MRTPAAREALESMLGNPEAFGERESVCVCVHCGVLKSVGGDPLICTVGSVSLPNSTHSQTSR